MSFLVLNIFERIFSPVLNAAKVKAERAAEAADAVKTAEEQQAAAEAFQKRQAAEQAKAEKEAAAAARKHSSRGGNRDTILEAAAKSTARSFGSSTGRTLVRGLLGSLGGRR